jgi:hypothetical protein
MLLQQHRPRRPVRIGSPEHLLARQFVKLLDHRAGATQPDGKMEEYLAIHVLRA